MQNHRWLAQQRHRLGITQKEAAKLAQIERSYYTKIENGVIPSVRVAKRIADVLKVDWSLFYK